MQGGVQHIRSSADFAYLVVFREYVDIVSFHVIGMFVDAVRAEEIVCVFYRYVKFLGKRLAQFLYSVLVERRVSNLHLVQFPVYQVICEC